jgi:hypothetical protein
MRERERDQWGHVIFLAVIKVWQVFYTSYSLWWWILLWLGEEMPPPGGRTVTLSLTLTLRCHFVVYYESIKRDLKIRCIYECRCDERLQTKTKEFTRLAYTGWSWNVLDPQTFFCKKKFDVGSTAWNGPFCWLLMYQMNQLHFQRTKIKLFKKNLIFFNYPPSPSTRGGGVFFWIWYQWVVWQHVLDYCPASAGTELANPILGNREKVKSRKLRGRHSFRRWKVTVSVSLTYE